MCCAVCCAVLCAVCCELCCAVRLCCEEKGGQEGRKRKEVGRREGEGRCEEVAVSAENKNPT